MRLNPISNHGPSHMHFTVTNSPLYDHNVNERQQENIITKDLYQSL